MTVLVMPKRDASSSFRMIRLVGRGSEPDHCVAAGQKDYEVLVDGVPDLQADDGSVWKAKAIWDLTAEGVPAIEEEYLGEQPASSGAGMP